MEDLFREILAPSPTVPSASLPVLPSGEDISPSQVTSPVSSPPLINIAAADPVDWEGEAEMQRLLDMLPIVHSDQENPVDGDADMNAVDFPSALELELCGWDINQLIQHPPQNTMVGAF